MKRPAVLAADPIDLPGLTLSSLTAHGFGVAVSGLERPDRLDDRRFEQLRLMWAGAGVMVLRGQQGLTPEQHIAFSRRFGPLEIHVQTPALLPGHPEILIVSNVIEDGRPLGLADAGHYWHSDLSYKTEPSLGSLLHAQELPVEGGDTLFVDMGAAYDALDDDLKQAIEGLHAEHSYAHRNALQRAKSELRPGLDAEQLRRVPPVVHPAVRTHPVTGRKALFVNEGFTTRLIGPADGPAAEPGLLERLFEHSTQPRFQYRHRWQPGDLVMWDNRSTMHFATGCPPRYRRTLYRTTVRGNVPR